MLEFEIRSEAAPVEWPGSFYVVTGHPPGMPPGSAAVPLTETGKKQEWDEQVCFRCRSCLFWPGAALGPTSNALRGFRCPSWHAELRPQKLELAAGATELERTQDFPRFGLSMPKSPP